MNDAMQPGLRTGTYRPDIDGLRAVAVMLVILNHIGIQRFANGYIGVDVFFVISGYLIGAHLLRDALGGGFSFARFYTRRFRRIVPALLFVLACTSVLAYELLPQSGLASFARSELGALFSVSNVVLSRQLGYFDPSGATRPLLHTWSLGVEEQFYIVFPFLILGVVRYSRRHLGAVLWIAAAVLLALQVAWNVHAPEEAYFLAPFRAGELLAGAALAATRRPVLGARWQREVAGWTGLIVIVASGMSYRVLSSNEAVHPVPWFALPPVLGALALLMAGDEDSWVSRCMGLAPLRALGLISYSVYLWHYPLIVFQKLQRILVPDRAWPRTEHLAELAASLALGALTWWLIEQPFRTGRLRKPALLFSLNGAAFALLTVFAWALVASDGYSAGPLPEGRMARAFGRASVNLDTRWNHCFLTQDQFPAHFDASCLDRSPSKENILLAGDSHAAYLYQGLKPAFADRNFGLISATGCAPLLPTQNGSASCDPFLKLLFDPKTLAGWDTVVLIAAWAPWEFDRLDQAIAALQARNVRVVLIGPTIVYDAWLLDLVEISHRDHDPDVMARHRVRAVEDWDHTLQQKARDTWHIPYVSIFNDLCRPELLVNNANAAGCPVFSAPGIPMEWDEDHPTPSGALMLAQQMRLHHELP